MLISRELWGIRWYCISRLPFINSVGKESRQRNIKMAEGKKKGKQKMKKGQQAADLSNFIA
ncbi:hypothetical protein M989_01005 [Kluyvera georgiana ATCC 51603]|uniref:Uncharacterized protein n=1 Tax=Kluyvera georgiana ATCC 51603 TaxID=1354264 RepID=A0A1B7K5Z2_9ENTR|nr:hypothetical protein M989_01005 [Kluyvera georgiana ATCC 51603]